MNCETLRPEEQQALAAPGWISEPDPETTVQPEAAEDGLSTGQFALLLAATLLAFFPGVALGLRTFFYRDFASYCYPLTLYTQASLLHGELPLWNPYTQCGVPLMAQLGQWYPPTLVSLLLPMPWAANFFLLLHLFWGGLGMRWLAGGWGARRFAAGFAGFAFVFNGVMLSSMIWAAYVAALAWLPWLVGSVYAAWKNGGRWLVFAAVAGAMQALSGMPEITALTWIFIAALWINALIVGEVQLWSSLRRMGAFVLLAAGLTMVQMLPFLDLVAHSQRNTQAATGAWSMPGWGWANLFVPLFHGYQAPQGPWFQTGQDLLPSYYLGAGVVALAIAGVWFARMRFTAAILGMTLLCWVMALGSNGMVYDWVRWIIPAIGFARYPVKFAILPAFLLPLLAAWAVQYLQQRPARATRARLATILGLILALMAALLGFAHRYPFPSDQWSTTAWNTVGRAGLMLLLLAGVVLLSKFKTSPTKTLLQLAVLAILPLDALTHSPNIAPTLPASALAPGIWQASGKSVPPKPGEGRIMLSATAEQELLFSRIPDLATDLTGRRLAEWYNLNLLDQVPKVNGAIPLHPAHFDRLEQHLYYSSGAHFGHGLLDFLSVAWFSAPENAVQWSARTNYLPGMTVGQAPIFSSDDQALAGITAVDFDPRAVVYLPESARGLVTVTNRTTCAVGQVHFAAHRVEAEVEASEPSLVVVSQTFYHLWQARIDDQPAALLRANLAFQALQVPAGKHRLTLIYRDRNLVIGAALSLCAAAICTLIWFRCGRQSRLA